MAESGPNATIVATVITVIGSVAVAVISNWNKIFPKPQVSPPPVTAVAPEPAANASPPPSGKIQVAPPVPIIDISGTWYNPAAPANGSRIVQQNSGFQFSSWGMLPQGIGYESKGSGTVVAQNITYNYFAQYQNGWTSQGNCSGTVSSDGNQITATCSDNVLGTFVSAGIKQ